MYGALLLGHQRPQGILPGDACHSARRMEKENGSFLDAEIREMKYLCKEKEDGIENYRQTIVDAEKEIAEAKEEIKTTRNKLALFVKLQKSIKKQQRASLQ